MNKLKRVSVYLDEEDYKKLRAGLILNGKSVSGWLRGVIKEFITDKPLSPSRSVSRTQSKT